MIELLILHIFYTEKSSIYRVKQKIDRLMCWFLKTSFGTIHPALKRLETEGYISVKSKLSEGGQKKSIYSITEKGKEYFKNQLSESLPDNPSLADQLIDIKLMSLNNMDDETIKAVKSTIIEYYKLQNARTKNILEDHEDELSEFQNKLISHKIDKIDEEIRWISQI